MIKRRLRDKYIFKIIFFFRYYIMAGEWLKHVKKTQKENSKLMKTGGLKAILKKASATFKKVKKTLKMGLKSKSKGKSKGKGKGKTKSKRK